MVETVKLSRNDWVLFNSLKEAIKDFTETLKETNKELEAVSKSIMRLSHK